MSVLIESVTVVIPRTTLDDFWPGATEAFLRAMRAPMLGALHACADPHLVAAGFATDDGAEPVTAQLRAFGLIETMDGAFHDFALVDARLGPTIPCPWLRSHHPPRGDAYAWLAGTVPGDLALPADWRHDPSTRLPRRICWDDFDEHRVACRLA